MIATCANTLWLAGCMAESARFHRASRDIAEEQQGLLRAILAANADTEFGRLHGFSSIRSYSDYIQRVPLRDYEGYTEWIDRAAQGVPNVLTREPVRLFEPTSGSSGSVKWIPYTQSLQREFQRGIRTWIADLFLEYPNLLGGQAYWSVSPVMAERGTTPGGIPIGFDDDTAYVGGWQRRLVNAVMAVPSHVRLTSDVDDFRYVTLLHLVRARNLRLVSIWNPSFFSLIVERLPEWGDRLVYDLRHGDLRHGIDSDPCLADEVRDALLQSTPQDRHARLWPKLGLISCWADANAAGPSGRLADLFPQSRIQAKGLIATEGFISLPLAGCDGAALAVRSHFFEFLPVDRDGEPDSQHSMLAGQLDPGQRYSVVLTTGGGLYRYRLNDLVEVIGRWRQCPLVRFAGRHGHVSDWFGEKLNEVHVRGIFESVFSEFNIAPAFAMLACDNSGAVSTYTLYLETSGSDATLRKAADSMERRLQENFHYRYARQLGQLGSLRIFLAQDAASAYLNSCFSPGQRIGDIKPPCLDRGDGWSGRFQGRFLEEPAAAHSAGSVS